MKSPLEFKTYLEWIEAKIVQNQSVHGYKARLADAAKCQRSYFSQVLGERAHLTPEQALGLAQYWNLSELETEFLELVHRDRAGSPDLKRHHSQKIEALKARAEDLKAKYRPEDLDEENKSIYYSDPIYSHVHMAVTIPALATTRAMAAALGREVIAMERILKQLEKMGLIAQTKDKWQATSRALHIGRDSPFVALNHQNWRGLAVQNAARKDPEGIHYTALYSLSAKDLETLRAKTLEWIDETRKLVAPSKEERMLCFLIDCFDPTR